MKKISSILVIAILIGVLSSCASYNHKLFNNAVSYATERDVPEKSAGCKATSYEMDITLDTNSKTVYGNTKVTCKNMTDSDIKDICFRLYSASISEGTIKKAFNCDTERDLEISTQRDSSVIYVKLGEDYIAPGGAVTLDLEFSSVIPETKNRFGYYNFGDGTIYNLTFCFPQLSFLEDGKWFEDKYIERGETVCNDMSDYYVKLTLPTEYTVVSGGTHEINEDGIIEINAPNVREMAITACNSAEIKTKEADGITYNILMPTYDLRSEEYRNALYDLILDVSIDAAEMYSDLVGDYIYDELDIVPMYIDNAGGMEMPGLVQVAIYDPDAEYGTPAGEISAHSAIHEVGHQWFYCAVGNNQSRDPWLDESFTSYLEYYYMTYGKKGITEITNFVTTHNGIESHSISNTFSDTDDGSVNKYINMKTSDYDDKSYEIVYFNGAWFLRKLELAMGEEKFKKMITEWYEENTYEIAGGISFINHVLEYDSSGNVKNIINHFISDSNLS